jgi:signal transduction histidine kinase
MVVNSLTHGFENKEAGEIKLVVSKSKNDVVIEYADNGRGLSESELDKLFDAFYTTKRGEGGSGLGTHIMYNLVTQTLNGQIEAKSAIGDGLKYTIRFPSRSA